MKTSRTIDILESTFDDLPVGVGIFEVPDPSDLKSIRYVFMNKVVLYEMRKSREEVFGKRIIEVAPEAYEHPQGLAVIRTYRDVAVGGGSVNLGMVEYSNHMVAGLYELSVHHIQENFVYVMLRNVTELEHAREDLERKNKELSQFAYIASHDLKEPLNTVDGFVRIIKKQYEGKFDEKADKLLGYISAATKRMKRLITDLLEYSDLGKGKEWVEVDCNALLDVLKEDMTARIEETNTTLLVEDLPTIKGFETELRLLFQNLISNAIKFKKPDVDPEIKIFAREESGWTFYISDNGIGISEEHQDKIFGIFERLHSKSQYEGSGIGLAHCKKIVAMHHGEIGVDSTHDEGSTFYFSIPPHEENTFV